MDWVTLSLVSLVAMSIMAVIMTSQIKKGISSQFVLAIVTAVWLVSYGILFWLEGINFIITGKVLIVIVIGGLIGVITNWLLFEAAASAPNLGFSFAIANTSPVLIAIMAVIFLGSELILEQFVGILIIVAGIVIINIFSENSKTSKRKLWMMQSFAALVFSAIIGILVTYLIKQGISTFFILVVMAVIYVISYSIWTYKKGVNFIVSVKVILTLITAGIFSVIANWAIYEAAASAPNPGYAFAISGTKPALIAILATAFLKSKLTLKQLAGIIICVIGVIIIVI